MVIREDGASAVCQKCIKHSYSIIEKNEAKRPSHDLSGLPSPRTIYASLDEYVIGQSNAKKVLAVACYNHYKRLLAGMDEGTSVEIDKSNIMMVGPTGTGKSLMAQTLAKATNVPLAITDATTLTEAGYVGEDVENILLKLIHAADNNIKKAQKGIIYIDEIDKCRRTSGNVSITRDVSGEGVQRGLLKIIEGTVASVPPDGGRKHPEQTYLSIDTKNILFILGGAFSGIEDIVAKRLNANAMGFGAALVDRNEEIPADDNLRRAFLLSKVTHEDLIEYGMMPELIGRIPVITRLAPLTNDEMIRILTEPKNAILKQYQALFSMDDATLEYTSDALTEIVAKANKDDTGARSLRSITESLLLDAMFSLPEEGRGKRYILTAEVVRGDSALKAA